MVPTFQTSNAYRAVLFRSTQKINQKLGRKFVPDKILRSDPGRFDGRTDQAASRNVNPPKIIANNPKSEQKQNKIIESRA